jgi:FO synthase
MSSLGSDHRTTLSYLAEAARAVHEQNRIVCASQSRPFDAVRCGRVARRLVSQGLMLESASERLCERGGPHYGSPDKHPRARLASIRAAGEQRVPFTSVF